MSGTIEPTTPEESDTKGWRHFVAGTFSGMAGVFIGHPFDTIKVRLQTQKPGPDGHMPYRNAIHCLFKTLRKEGPRGLYKGMASPLLGDSFTNAFVFGLYGAARNIQLSPQHRPNSGQQNSTAITEQEAFARLSLTQIGIAGAVVGVVAPVILCPVELIKIRLQVQASEAEKLYKGPIDCIIKTVKRDGLQGLQRGLTATWLRDVPGFAAYFWFYEGLRRWYANEGESVDDIASWKQLVAGGIGGIAGWVCSYPADVIKSRMQTDRSYRNVWHCTVDTYRTGGMPVFFAGVGTTIVRAFPVNAVVFIAYEVIMVALYRYT